MADTPHVCIDKWLPENLVADAARRAVAENAENAPRGALGVPAPKLALITGKKWANGRTIRCYFMRYMQPNPPSVVQKIIDHMKLWEAHANVKFDFTATQNESDVRIGLIANSGSWSYIGTDCLAMKKDQPTMNFGWLTVSSPDDEYQRVVVHEVGHCLGAVHEHQNPVADIPWDKPAVYAYYMGPPNNWSKADVDNNLFAKYSVDMTQYSAWDTKSVMHYPIPAAHTAGRLIVPWNTGLSQGDKDFIALAYPRADMPGALKFAANLYRAVLGLGPVGPEAQGAALSALANGRPVVVQALERSRESTDRIAGGMYTLLLGRPPDPGALTGFYNAIAAGTTEEQLTTNLVVSDEYAARAADFTSSVWTHLLGRVPEPPEAKAWGDAVKTYGKPTAVAAVCVSTEYRGRMITDIFRTRLGRTPALADIQFWITSKLDLAHVRYAVEASPEFYGVS